MNSANWHFFILSVVFFSCSSLDNFEVDVEARTTIEKSTVLEQLAGDIGFEDLVTFDLKNTSGYSNENIDENDIDSVKMTRLRLTIESPEEGIDFTFLENIAFFVEGEGLPRKRLAFGGPFEPGEKVIELALEDTELKPYLALDTMDVTTDVTGQRPAEDTEVRADLKFNIDVDVSNALCGK